MNDIVNHPRHYQAPNGLEAIDVIEAFGHNESFALGNALKYLLRAGRKGDTLEDLKKCRWYLNRKIESIETGAPDTGSPLLYLATPYSKYMGGDIEAAFVAACKIAADLLVAGHRVYSPIAHTHPLAVHSGLDPLDHSIWLPFDEAMMDAADTLLVAQMPGWRDSFGINHEIEYFKKTGKRIEYLDVETLAVSAEPRAEAA